MYYLSSIGYHPLAVKILDNNLSRQRGFMGWSRSPNDHYGMLFHHSHAHPQSYWMHTVPFDLDALGFDEDDKLVEILNLKAHSKASNSFSVPVRHVVEVRGGWCKDNGIKTGCRLKLKR